MEAEMHGSASTWTHLDLVLVFSSCLDILLFVDEVLCLSEQMVRIVKNPRSYSGITLGRKGEGD